MHILWLDFETTGLNPDTDALLQVGAVLTTEALDELAAVEVTLWQPESVLATIVPRALEMHARSGLLERVRKSTAELVDAERALLIMLSGRCEPGQVRLGGSSVHFDRGFSGVHLPGLMPWLHHRQVDVSTLLELASAWAPELRAEAGPAAHTALADVRRSLAAARHFRAHLFQPAREARQKLG